MNPLRYFLRALAFSALRGWPIRARYACVLAGRAIGGWFASMGTRRKGAPACIAETPCYPRVVLQARVTGNRCCLESASFDSVFSQGARSISSCVPTRLNRALELSMSIDTL